MGIIKEDLYDHEGYAEREADGLRAACSCGWRSELFRPYSDGAADNSDLMEALEEAADSEWDRDHATPLLAKHVPDEVWAAVNGIIDSVNDLRANRPAAAVEVLTRLQRWSGLLLKKIADEG